MPLPQMLQDAIKHPSMYFLPVEFDAAASFLCGFDLGNNGLALVGFHEWLVTRFGRANNLAWPPLVLHLAFPDAASPRDCLRDAAGQQLAIDTLFRLLAEFWHEREAHEGLRRIYLKYEQWLRRQTWYGPSSPHYFDKGKDG